MLALSQFRRNQPRADSGKPRYHRLDTGDVKFSDLELPHMTKILRVVRPGMSDLMKI